MKIEESIEILKNSKNLYLKEKIDSDILEEAIETLLSAYEKEKEKNKTLEELLQGNLFELYKYYKELANKYQGSCVSKSDLKQIVDECIPKKENIITRELEYTPNVNANSYLAQEILLLIKEE